MRGLYGMAARGERRGKVISCDECGKVLFSGAPESSLNESRRYRSGRQLAYDHADMRDHHLTFVDIEKAQ
jgi:hypothetical protein